MSYNQNYYSQPQQNGAMPDMLNQFKAQYQQMPQNIPMQQPTQAYYQPYQNQIPVMSYSPQSNFTSQITDERIWVQGEPGAKAYFVAANATVVLWDTERPVFYIKSADATGKPLVFETYDIIKRTTNNVDSDENIKKDHECQCGNKFASKEAHADLRAKIEQIQNDINDLKTKPKSKTTKSLTTEAEDE